MKNSQPRPKLPLFRLVLILLLALAVRLYKIDIPLADHHSWRQADTAAVARNFIKEGFDFLRPRIDNMAPLHQNAIPNSERLFLTEPPIYNSLVALVYRFFGLREAYARTLSILFSLGSTVFLFLLTSSSFGSSVGLFTAFFFAVLPFNIYFSRVILPEPMIIFLNLGMLFFFQAWLQKKSRRHFLLALFFTALSLTQKAFPFFLALPLAYLVFKTYGVRLLTRKKEALALLVFVILALLPFAAWRLWVRQFPEGTPPYLWLLNLGEKGLAGIRFRPAFFRWIFYERIAKLILAGWGLPLLVLGLILKPDKKTGWFYHFWLLSFFLYATVFAAGSVTHDYYQIPFIPVAAVFLGRGADFLFKAPKRFFSPLISRLSLFTCLVFFLGFSWYQVQGFYLIQGGVDIAGSAVDQLTPKNALVLTGDTNDVTLLYNCNRHGWTGGYASYYPNLPESIERLRQAGAEYYVTTKVGEINDSDFGQYLFDHYKVVSQSDQYILFDLR